MLPNLLLDVLTEVYRALGLLTDFRVVTTKGKQLFAYGTAIGLAFALASVRHHALHLLTAGRPTVGVAALTCMHQTVDTALDSCDTIRIAAILVSRISLSRASEVKA